MNKRINLSLAKMGENELKYIKSAFDTHWVAPLGPNVNAFEADLESFLAASKPVAALSSGTAAIHLALLQLGVGPDDEVLCQSLTFSATANPVKYLGATPVFIDSESSTWNMDPELMEHALQDRFIKRGKYPKAIIPVHLYGMPSSMDRIIKIAEKYSIPVLEDAAEALGSSFNNLKCGNFGEFACLSFNGNKIITTSGGGALVCSSVETKNKTIFYSTQARENASYYQHEEVGYNYRMSNICAGIGRGQMELLPGFVERRREIHEMYVLKLSNLPGVSFQNEPDIRYFSNYWLTVMQIDSSKLKGKSVSDLISYLDEFNIESRHVWKPMHLQPVFLDCPYYGGNVSESLFENGICLPSGCSLTDEDVFFVIDRIITFFNANC